MGLTPSVRPERPTPALATPAPNRRHGTILHAFTPNSVISVSAMQIIIVMEVFAFLVLWTLSPFKILPRPVEVASAFGELWMKQGLGRELIASFSFNVEALTISSILSLGVAYLGVMPAFRPIVAAISKGRFLSLVGFSLLFTVVIGGGHTLKVSLLVFGMSVFFLTSMASVIAEIPMSELDYARTLHMSEWRVVWEVVILGTADKALEVLRQNAAMGWMMLTMVETIVRSEGGVGVLLMNNEKYMKLSEVFAIQLAVLFVGLFQDAILGLIRRICCPYAYLTVERAKSSTGLYYEFKETLLKAENVSLHLGGKQILRDVNVDLKNITRPGMTQGQIVGLLGPSGMGKTQLFRILSGLNIPDTGTVTLRDGIPVSPGKVGVVAQNYPLLMHRTVMGNMIVAGRRAKLTAEASTTKAKEILAKFGVDEHCDKYPAQLSGGQRQRVSIAQQLVCSDHVLLMDEPFSGLDPNALTAVCDFLYNAAQLDDYLSFVVVTHDIESAVRICDTLWLLGRERDAQGNPIPGANIRHEINLIDCGLAWHQGIEEKHEFFEKVKEIKSLFVEL